MMSSKTCGSSISRWRPHDVGEDTHLRVPVARRSAAPSTRGPGSRTARRSGGALDRPARAEVEAGGELVGMRARRAFRRRPRRTPSPKSSSRIVLSSASDGDRRLRGTRRSGDPYPESAVNDGLCRPEHARQLVQRVDGHVVHRTAARLAEVPGGVDRGSARRVPSFRLVLVVLAEGAAAHGPRELADRAGLDQLARPRQLRAERPPRATRRCRRSRCSASAISSSASRDRRRHGLVRRGRASPPPARARQCS